MRIRQQGGGASHLDAVLLDGPAPLAARGGKLDKLGRCDNDLTSATDRTVELTLRRPLAATATWPDRPHREPGHRQRAAAVPDGEHLPDAVDLLEFLFLPPGQRRSAAGSGSAAAPGWPRSAGASPCSQVLAPTGSGHPAGYTYGWVSNDRRNLYVTIDFTPDNT